MADVVEFDRTRKIDLADKLDNNEILTAEDARKLAPTYKDTKITLDPYLKETFRRIREEAKKGMTYMQVGYLPDLHNEGPITKAFTKEMGKLGYDVKYMHGFGDVGVTPRAFVSVRWWN